MPLQARPDAGSISFDLQPIADIFAQLTLDAAIAVMRVYEGECHARSKPDHSPVCDADEYAEAIILEGLSRLLPQFPVVAEEASAHGNRPECGGRPFILVDPVDGTREFLSRNGEFTINIGLIVEGSPCAGVVYAPALRQLWWAGETAFSCMISPGERVSAAEKTAIRARPAPHAGWTALASRSHADAQTDAFLARLPIAERQSAGSSLKFCKVAEGGADVYPRFGPTMEWDTAAGDAVLRAAGGMVLDADGKPMRYGKAEVQFKNGPFVAWGDPTMAHMTLTESARRG